MNFIVIIPARFYSTRFPGKPLADIQGKPMIVRVMENALMSNAVQVIVATDHVDIANAIKKENTSVDVFLSQIDHCSGIERLEEVVNEYNFSDHQVIVNLQGDEPLVSSEMINFVANDLLMMKNDISMSTLATHISSFDERYNSNVVKVVTDFQSNALYFSRSMIPWCKKEFLYDDKDDSNNILLLRHIGVYSYYVKFIRIYNSWKASPLEKIESLEQLRVLWYGEKVHVVVIDDQKCYFNVDTPEELMKVNKFLIDGCTKIN